MIKRRGESYLERVRERKGKKSWERQRKKEINNKRVERERMIKC